MVRAWYMDDSDLDQRYPHMPEPTEFCRLEKLKELGVDYWWFDPEKYIEDPEYEQMKRDKGFCYQDECLVSPSAMEKYDEKVKSFYEEHMHKDDEIRFVIGGSGYFDVRDKDDKWVRIEVTSGDMIVLPAGIYHRFTVDMNDYIRAIRLFAGEPVWTPYPRTK